MKYFFSLVAIIIISLSLTAQNNEIKEKISNDLAFKNPIILNEKEAAGQRRQLKSNGIYPNFWQAVPSNCVSNFYVENEKIMIEYNCDGEKTIFTLSNIQYVIDGFVNPEPANASTFILNKRNLFYTSNPENLLNLKMNYEGNGILKVFIKSKDFLWDEKFSINFEKEYACPIGIECEEYNISNNNTRILQKYLLDNEDLYSYLQELVNKIAENKSQNENMAKIAAIFIKNWLIQGINPKVFYNKGIISKIELQVHCVSPSGMECYICKRTYGDIVKEVCVFFGDCQTVIWDP